MAPACGNAMEASAGSGRGIREVMTGKEALNGKSI